MKLENIILSEISQSHTHTQILHDSTYVRYLRVAKIIQTESRMVVAKDWGKGKVGSYCLTGTELPFYKINSYEDRVR